MASTPTNKKVGYLTLEQAADYVGLSTKSLRRYIADGKLVAHRVGRTIRIKPESLDNMFTATDSFGVK